MYCGDKGELLGVICDRYEFGVMGRRYNVFFFQEEAGIEIVEGFVGSGMCIRGRFNNKIVIVVFIC